jgi:uncharacterized membrane protein YfcA
MVLLVGTFLVIAVLYASVGFGGGSSYTAMLMVADTDYRLVPIISLICNLIVVTGGVIQFAGARLIKPHVVVPCTLLSIPMAWIGGITPIDNDVFLLLLALSLLASGAAMLITPAQPKGEMRNPSTRKLWAIGITVGGTLGYLAGLVGIGGGIFLAPALHLLRLAPPKVVAATASFFILVNSLSGLLGHWLKLGELELRGELVAFVWLFPAVLIGGQLGSRAGIRILRPVTVRRLTAMLVIIVGIRLLFSWYTMIS